MTLPVDFFKRFSRYQNKWIAVTATSCNFIAANADASALKNEVEKKGVKNPAYHFIPDFSVYYAP